MKLLSFEGGVTVQGGLPVPIATPAHGTAFDIVGQNRAEVRSTQNAFDVACTMAERRIAKAALPGGEKEVSVVLEKGVGLRTSVVEMPSCC